jgi:lactate permease
MPVELAALATLYGGAFGLFPVCWIVITALFIYNMSVKTGQFEVIKNSLASISDDRRLQALLIAFSFGAFIEGAAGFGTPVAITYGGNAGRPRLQSAVCRVVSVCWPIRHRSPGAPSAFPS